MASRIVWTPTGLRASLPMAFPYGDGPYSNRAAVSMAWLGRESAPVVVCDVGSRVAGSTIATIAKS